MMLTFQYLLGPQSITLRVTVRQNAICQFAWLGDNGEYCTLDEHFAAEMGRR
ncbi:hypothetical protein [Pectobacterium atrosepticum]|uniref:hypothetical protein n=1 Tax=Pectobacterium atrosepticum TaxID=29471 RepID=UPI001F2904C8|nr:hypothetical protein [Pectobacterium atrosepticum]